MIPPMETGAYWSSQTISEAQEAGYRVVATDPDGPHAAIYRAIGEKSARSASPRLWHKPPRPKIVIEA
jgi:hypothetical protein